MKMIVPLEIKRLMVLMWVGSSRLSSGVHFSGTAQSRHELHARPRYLLAGISLNGRLLETSVWRWHRRSTTRWLQFSPGRHACFQSACRNHVWPCNQASERTWGNDCEIHK